MTDRNDIPGQGADLERCQSGNDQSDRTLRLIAEQISRRPDVAPPADLLAGVMASIRPKKLSLPKRAWIWLKSPHTVRITPLRLIPAGAAVAAVLILALLIQPDNGISTGITRPVVAISAPESQPDYSVVFLFRSARRIIRGGDWNVQSMVAAWI